MSNYLVKRIFELFQMKISDQDYCISLFEFGLSAEQVLYFLLDISENIGLDISEYYLAIENCSLSEIQKAIENSSNCKDEI